MGYNMHIQPLPTLVFTHVMIAGLSSAFAFMLLFWSPVYIGPLDIEGEGRKKKGGKDQGSKEWMEDLHTYIQHRRGRSSHSVSVETNMNTNYLIKV